MKKCTKIVRFFPTTKISNKFIQKNRKRERKNISEYSLTFVFFSSDLKVNRYRNNNIKIESYVKKKRKKKQERKKFYFFRGTRKSQR